VGNVRNPVGPLPSSIYWRRRAVVLCLCALLVVLVVWAVTSIGSGGSAQNEGAPHGGRSPLPSITPGPSASSTGITSAPGGRDTSGGSGSSGGSGESGGAATSASPYLPGAPPGAADGSGTGGSRNGSSGGDVGGAGISNPPPLPNSSNLPDCSSPQVQLKVRSVQGSYDPGQKPKFVVTAVNSGSSACKVNFGATAAVVSVVDSSGNHVWSSDNCPSDRNAYLLEVPANGYVSYTLQWDLRKNSPQCAEPAGTGNAGPGTYEVKVSESGIGSGRGSFVLTQYGS
jgi:hypothetical protein